METGYLLGVDFQTWWYLVIGATFTAYAILDGFDLGAGVLHLFFKKDLSRRIALNAVGPLWDGNEVWLVITGGALFAGFPIVYASAFSAFYVPFMLLLAAIIGRAISIEFRSKEPMKWWRQFWDVSYSLSSLVIIVLLGVALGNVIIGLPLNEQQEFHGELLFFLKPYPILIGLTLVGLYALHGAVFLSMKTEGRLYAKLTIMIRWSLRIFLTLFALLSLITVIFYPQFIARMEVHPWLFVVPLLVMILLVLLAKWVKKKKYPLAFAASSLIIALMMMLVFIQQFPLLLPSTNPDVAGLDIYNSASSTKTLKILLTIAAIGVPLIAFYFGFVYKTFKGKVEMDETSY